MDRLIVAGRAARIVVTAAALFLASCSSPAATSTPAPTLSASTTADPGDIPASTPSSTAAPVSASPAETATPTVTPTTTPTPEIVRGPIDAAAAMAFAVGLADEVGMRIPGTAGDAETRRRFTEAVTAAGWQVQPDPLALPQGGETANLLATIDGQIPTGPMVIIGSHMDTLGGVGANDNASGVGVLVEVARELADEAALLPVPVVLVAFAAEEKQDAPGRPNHLGSEQLATALGERTIAMLSVDMIGNGPTTRIMGVDGTIDTLVRRIESIATRDGIADVVTGSRGNVSDHGPFALRGIPAAFLWTGPDDSLHTAADTSDHLDIDDIVRAGALTLAFVRDLTVADAAGLVAAAS